MKNLITLLMLFAFTISLAMPKEVSKNEKQTTYENIYKADIPSDCINMDIAVLQNSEIYWRDKQVYYNSKGFHIFNLSESRFIGSFTQSGFSENINTNCTDYSETQNSKVQTFYSKVIQKGQSYKSRMHLRRIQRSNRAAERSNYAIKRDHYFKRKYSYLSSFKNTKLGNAFNMDWRCLRLINSNQIAKA